MKKVIGIIGLGIIGGSLAASAKQKTAHTVLGFDTDANTMRAALGGGAIDAALTPDRYRECDMIIIALYPAAAARVLQDIAPDLHRGAVVVDCCGIKRDICRLGAELAEKYGFSFVGGHPMAGRECWGFQAATAQLFDGASMIITPRVGEDEALVSRVGNFFLEIGFGKITRVTAEDHDRIIACTSQLAHVLSSSYIRSETAAEHEGLSAGSFKDMTRVAALNDVMWSEIFLMNKDNLLSEIDGLIRHLSEYRDAIAGNEREKLKEMMRDSTHKRALYFHNKMI
ncbi:MAG: prephenate dehydrogenase [Ruminococcaceae bacterium]|nr:prephenate dehydrogenase [Oscillospiraceae bacterium]